MEPQRAGSRMLVAASAALVASVVVHGVDHALQERGIGALTYEVRIGGFANAALAAIAFVLALRGNLRAPGVAAAVGAYLAVNVTAAHFLPHWSALSDPYADADLGFVSWAAAAAEAGAAAILAIVGLLVLRQRRVVAPAVPG